MLGWPAVLFGCLFVGGVVLLAAAGVSWLAGVVALGGAFAAALGVGLVGGRGRLRVNVSLLEILGWPVVALAAGGLSDGDEATAIAVFLWYAVGLYGWRVALSRRWLRRT